MGSAGVHQNFPDPIAKRAIPSAAANPVAAIVNQKLTGEAALRKSFTRPRTIPVRKPRANDQTDAAARRAPAAISIIAIKEFIFIGEYYRAWSERSEMAAQVIEPSRIVGSL